jgi:hypothetical protein
MYNARELSSRLLVLLRCEQGAMADFLVALADFDQRRLWVGMGYTSLFYYLRRELKLSSGAAFLRKTAAELLQRFPEVEAPLRDGRLCISSVCELAKVITPENRAQVLPRFFHASKNEAKAVAAEIAPREAVPQRVVVTTVASGALPSSAATPSSEATERPAPAPTLELGQTRLPGETPAVAAAPAAGGSLPPRALPPSHVMQATIPRSTSEPLTATLHRLHATVSKEFMRKLAAAKDALSHSHPGADEAAILEAGLDLILERAAKRKGLVKRPRKEGEARRKGQRTSEGARSPPDAESRHIPADVKRQVWLRDGGRCVWPTADGSVCGSTCRVQYDHIVPVARGGQSTVGNLRLACALHNDLAARQSFGDAWMDRYTRGAAPPPSEHAAPP